MLNSDIFYADIKKLEHKYKIWANALEEELFDNHANIHKFPLVCILNSINHYKMQFEELERDILEYNRLYFYSGKYHPDIYRIKERLENLNLIASRELKRRINKMG